jgi:hypothetical protein
MTTISRLAGLHDGDTFKFQDITYVYRINTSGAYVTFELHLDGRAEWIAITIADLAVLLHEEAVIH